jgi:hypothetical protein
MALGGALERAGFDGEGPKFSVKGGVALELRLRGRARATRDLDLVLNDAHTDLVDALDSVLRNRCEGFTFRRRGEVRWLPGGAVRADVAVQYGGSTWGRIQVDLGRTEGSGGVAVEMVEGLDLSFFGFEFPERVPCLSLYAQAAQKIHGLTLPSRPGWRNDRFKDLVDLLLIEELIQDHDALRRACEDLFAMRNTHPWPPFVQAPSSWLEPFRRMAVEVDLPVTDVNQAAFRIRRLLNDVDPKAQLFRTVVMHAGVSATNWYYALGADDRPYRVPVTTAEALMERSSAVLTEVPPAWYRDPGGIVLVEILVFLRNRAPAFVAQTATHEIAIEDTAIGMASFLPPVAWENLAEEVLRRAKSVSSSATMLASFLADGRGASARIKGELSGVTVRGALVLSADTLNTGHRRSPMWSFAEDDLVIPVIPTQPESGAS